MMNPTSHAALIGVTVCFAAVACGGGNAEAEDPRALPDVPSAALSGANVCSVKQITINEPETRAVDRVSASITGRVDTECAEVWVIAHPVGSLDYYALPKAAVRSSREWLTSLYFSKLGGGATGLFEVLAVANPHQPLLADMRLPGWPEGEARSEVLVLDNIPEKECAKDSGGAAASNE